MANSHPLDGKLVVLTGGSGFIGNYVAQALLETGARLRIASRHPEKGFTLKPLANLGQLQFARCDITNEASVEATLRGADAVVNLVGSFEGDLDRLMGRGSGTVARLAKAAGATALVHVSAIGADIESETGYGHAKGLGEKLVLENFAEATILRPSLVFGKDDEFLNMFAGLISKMPVLPVFGPDAPLQPVFVDDVAEAVVRSLAAPAKHGGKIYELGGPETVTMMELNERIAEAQGRDRSFIPVPDAVSGIFATLPLTPMSSDQWALLKDGNTVSEGAAGFAKLGIEPRPIGLFLERWMTRYRRHGRFTASAA